MSKAQRDKGQVFEREICALLSDHLGTVVKRNLAQTRGGATEGSDITIGRFSIECKRRARISIYDWLDQAARDAGDKVPVVVARGDGRRAIAIMDLEALIPMLRDWVDNVELSGPTAGLSPEGRARTQGYASKDRKC